MADKEANFVWVTGIFVVATLLHGITPPASAHVINLDLSDATNDGVSIVRHSLQKRDVDPKCQSQEKNFLQNPKEKKIDKVHMFTNESKYAMALAWAGANDGTLIVVTSTDLQGITLKSSLYRSTDFGANFEDVTKKYNISHTIRKHNGLQRHPFDPKKVYLVTDSRVLYITEDGGLTFDSFNIPMAVDGELIFHPSKHYQTYILAKTPSRDLYFSLDDGRTWSKIQSNVEKVYWGNPDAGCCDTGSTVYATTGGMKDTLLSHLFNLELITTYTLVKSEASQDWTTLLEHVVSFERSGDFLYASVLTDANNIDSTRKLRISKDSGKTWHDAQLPTIESDRFYSVMEMDKDMIFMHVDNKDDTGHGTLYTSGNDGIIYSESLRRHLYPNFGVIHDFYKVKSMRGVYITSQMNDDDSIHTMISYNRGASWQKIPKPDNADCKDKNKECNLQLHGMYSMKRLINSLPPLSEETATGIIMAHGHVADALQRSNPDVFVTSDGGYTWRKSLDGPHHYQIGDHGGLLAAVSRSEPNPKVVKFSTDEGNCWHEYTFTNKTLNFTGLLTEPEGKSSVVMIWGYTVDTKKWEVHIIDFKDVIPKKCSDTDYEPWMPHSTHRAKEGKEVTGCLLGMRETILRLKKDSWCYNGYEHEKFSKKENCTCTREDYECDYGYYRPGGSDKCIEIPEFKRPDIDVCLRGHREQLVSEGYRKIPGDTCKDGFKPTSKLIDLQKECKEGAKTEVKINETPPKVAEKQPWGKTIIIIVAVIVIALALLMSIYFIRKFIILRRHQVEYRFSLLNQSERERDIDHDLENALHPTSVIFDDSDEEELQTSSSRPNGHIPVNKPDYKTVTRQDPKPVGKPDNKSTFKADFKTEIKKPYQSYHDDSDDDLLS